MKRAFPKNFKKRFLFTVGLFKSCMQVKWFGTPDKELLAQVNFNK